MNNEKNRFDIGISTHLSTFQPELGNFLSTLRVSLEKGVLIKKKNVYIEIINRSTTKQLKGRFCVTWRMKD